MDIHFLRDLHNKAFYSIKFDAGNISILIDTRDLKGAGPSMNPYTNKREGLSSDEAAMSLGDYH